MSDVFAFPSGTKNLKAIDQQEQLVEDAWEIAKDLLQTGEATLKDGKTKYKLTSKDLLKLVQWLASQKQKKPTGLVKPKDSFLRKTTGNDSPIDDGDD